MHSSSTRTITTKEHFDEEGRLVKRVTKDVFDEFTDLDGGPSFSEDEKVESDEAVPAPFIPNDPYKYQIPSSIFSPPPLPEGWKVYCINGISPCPSHSDYPGRSAG